MNRALPPWAFTVAVLLLTTAYFFVYNAPTLASPLHFSDDLVQHYLWVYETDWADDFYARTSGALQPWGFYGLQWLLSRVADPLTIGDYAPLLTTLLIAYFVARALRRYLPALLAIVGAFFVLQFTMVTGLGFLARGFATPLLAAFAHYLLANNRWGIAATILASALFYPPILLINSCILVCWELGRLLLDRRSWDLKRYGIFAAAGLVSVAIVAAHAYTVRHSPDLGEFFPVEALRSMPEFGGSGRVAFTNITNSPTEWMMRYFLRLFFGTWPAPDFGMFLMALAAVLGVFSFRKTGPLGAYLLLFFGSTILLYDIARITTPLLFLADRYTVYPWRYGVPLVCVFIAGALYHLYPRQWVAGVATVVILALAIHYRAPSEQPFLNVDGNAELYAYLSTLPEDAMIVAPPDLASYIPIVCRRSVLLSNEAAHALYLRNYYDYVTPRFADYTYAITAPVDSFSRIPDFLDKYAVDYLIIDRRMPEGRAHRSFSPYNEQFEAGTRVQDSLGEAVPGETRELAALTIPDSVGVRVGEFLVVERGAVGRVAEVKGER